MERPLTCGQTTDLLGPYVDNELPTESRRRVEAHLLACTTCAWDAHSMRIAKERLKGESEEVVASDAFRARVFGRLLADNPHVTGSEPETVSPEQFRLPFKV
jgi:anti-sigma factor RsiW